MATVAERVAAGATLLDQKKPGWAKKISLPHLDVGDCLVCVLAQLSGSSSYCRGARMVLNTHPSLIEGNKFLAEHGFNADHSLENRIDIFKQFQELTAAWAAEINKRLAA